MRLRHVFSFFVAFLTRRKKIWPMDLYKKTLKFSASALIK